MAEMNRFFQPELTARPILAEGNRLKATGCKARSDCKANIG